MTRAGRTRAIPDLRVWPVATAPGKFVAYVMAVNLVAVIWTVVALFRLRSSAHEWAVLGLLIALSLVFEEGARRAARLQLRLSADLKRDMTSVWCVAGAVGLRPGYAVILLVTVMSYVWLRQQRPAGEILHRKVFNASTALLGCLGSGLALHAGEGSWHGYPLMLSGAVSVVVVIVVHTLINRALVTGGLTVLGARGRELLGSADDNLIEVATLCLGGLVALAVLFQPWLAILVLAPMITLQRGALVRELETAAMVDAKTGLLNAVAWEQLAKRELGRAERDKSSVGILIIDIDRFKLVNDRFGHIAGDKVLREVARRLGAEVREYDTVGRFGGEEFVAVLPSASEVEALVVAERLRSRVNDLLVSSIVEGISAADDYSMAVSIGVSCTPTDGAELADLLLAADSALYRAKSGGRNRVVLAERGTGDSFERVSSR
jgi:diguanylate cyclase (GGDEF)-like protein